MTKEMCMKEIWKDIKDYSGCKLSIEDVWKIRALYSKGNITQKK